MRKAAKQILLCAAALLLVCIVCRAAFFDHINIYIPLQGTVQPGTEIDIRQPDVLRPGRVEERAGYLRIPVYPESRGEADLVYGSAENNYL